LAVGVTVLTPALVMAAGDKAAAERGAADRAAAEKAAADKGEKAAADRSEKAPAEKTEKASQKADKAASDAAEKADAPADKPARADAPEAAQADAPKPADKPAGEPLALRPAHPVDVVPTSTPTMGLGTKIALAAMIGGVAFFVYRRRAGQKPGRVPALRVTARASIGARTEVCIVEVDGQRLLLGVTPSSIRTLTVLTQEELVEATTTPAEESLARLFASAKRDLEPDPEPLDEPVRRLPPPQSRPVPATRGRSTHANDSSRPTVTSPLARAEKELPATRKSGGRRSSPDVEGQVSGLVSMRSGRS
jgi:flagellar biogenesis protein FliO